MVKVLIASVVIVAVLIVLLGLKRWLNPEAEIMAHACDFDPEKRKKKNIDCDKCELKDIVNCEKE